jgi:hypothetical protein
MAVDVKFASRYRYRDNNRKREKRGQLPKRKRNNIRQEPGNNGWGRSAGDESSRPSDSRLSRHNINDPSTYGVVVCPESETQRGRVEREPPHHGRCVSKGGDSISDRELAPLATTTGLSLPPVQAF